MDDTKIMNSGNRPLVVIQCMVYNHASFLRECFDGFVMQQTNFQYVVLVHDDFSTDESVDIILEYKEKYPHMFHLILEKENQYSKQNGILWRITNNAICEIGAKYVAICEGDDYWVDPFKLQKQVDILEADGTLMAVCTDTSIVDKEGRILCPKRGRVVKDDIAGRYTLRDFFKYNHQYPTASIVYRNANNEEISKKYLSTVNNYLGDWTMWICLHIYGDFYYINEPMVAYRINPTSLTHSNFNTRRLGLARANFQLIPAVASVLPDQYQDIKDDLTKNTAWMWLNLANAYKYLHQYLKMLGCLIICCIKNPKVLYNKIRVYSLAELKKVFFDVK
jgi:glycosyltransferase involved in cell wall biosynthesis